MGHNRARLLSYPVYNLLGEKVWFYRRYAVTLNPLHLVELPEQCKEVLPLLLVRGGMTPEVTYIDPVMTISRPPSAATPRAISTISLTLPERDRPRAKGIVQ